MSRDKNIVAVMKATGCKYMTALAERNRRVQRGEQQVWYSMIAALPALPDGQRRCVTCLAPKGDTRCVCGGTGRA